MTIALNISHEDTFDVWDADGNSITGLVQGNFTVYIYNPLEVEVSGTATWAITELGYGLYEFSFTPTSEGRWTVKIIHATYFGSGLHNSYQVNDSSLDTIEDKLDIIDTNVDTILLSTDTMEADLKTYITDEHNTTDGLITTVDTVVDSILTDTATTIPVQITSVHGTTDTLITSETTAVESHVTSEHTTTKTAISTSESNIRGTDNDTLKILSEQIDTIQNNTFVNFRVPGELGKPDTGSIVYQIILEIFDTSGNIEIPDSTPTIKIEEYDGTVIVAETSMSSYASGQYYYDYTLPYTQINGVVIATAKVTEGSVIKKYKQPSIIKDYVELSSLDTKLDTIQADVDTLENEMLRALGLMQENQKIVTVAKSATGKMLTGIKYLYDSNDFDTANITAIYDITVTYDNNDQGILFTSIMRD